MLGPLRVYEPEKRHLRTEGFIREGLWWRLLVDLVERELEAYELGGLVQRELRVCMRKIVSGHEGAACEESAGEKEAGDEHVRIL
jgi:hypothetical protein